LLVLVGGFPALVEIAGPASAEPSSGAGCWSDSFDEPNATGGISEMFNITVENGSARPGWDIGTGSGNDGNLTVIGAMVVDTVKTTLSTSAPSGNGTINVSSSDGFSTGDELLIIQMSGNGTGAREFVRVSAVGGNIIAIEPRLEHSYNVSANASAQCIRVPQYTEVIVPPGGTLTCTAWNGNNGGVLCFRVTGNLTVERGGAVDVAGKGFAGNSAGSGGMGGMGGSGGSGGASAGGGNNGSAGSNGSSSPGGGPGGNGGNGSYYKGGKGGSGGAGPAGNNGSAGSGGAGPGGGGVGSGGANCATVDLETLQPGSGGGGGTGGNGGQGGGGGGGGGGGANSGRSGSLGGFGGSGSSGGAGGKGGGIMVVAAGEIAINGLLSANGTSGNNGLAGGNGNRGGGGGNGGSNGTVAGNATDGGGGGGGGMGSAGGNGGCGGGGGAGGSIWLTARRITLSEGSVFASGGQGGSAGRGGSGGTGGTGGSSGGGNATAGGAGPAGINGTNGTDGTAGMPGMIRLDTPELSGTTVPPAGWSSRPDHLTPASLTSMPVTIPSNLLWKTFDADFTSEPGATIDFELLGADGTLLRTCRGQDLPAGGLDISDLKVRSLRLRAVMLANGSSGAALDGWNLSWYTIANRDPLAPGGLSADGHPSGNPAIMNLTDPTPLFRWKFQDPDEGQLQGAFNVSVHSGPGHSGTLMWEYESVSGAQCVTYGSGGGARPLENGSDYYFSARVRDDFPPAPGWSFTSELAFHIDAPPAIPERMAPDGTAPVSSPIRLEWAPAADMEGSFVTYEFQVSQNGDFSRPAANGTTEATGALVALPAAGEYRWRLRAYDDYASSGWSPVWAFNCSGPDRPPSVGPIPDFPMHFNQTADLDLSIFCSDPEDGTDLTFEAERTGGPPAGLEVKIEGRMLGLASGSVEGNFTVGVIVMDSWGASARGNLTVRVTFMPPIVSMMAPIVINSSSSFTVDIGGRVSPQAGGGIRIELLRQGELADASISGLNLTLTAGARAGNGTVVLGISDDFGQKTVWELAFDVVPSPGSGPRLALDGSVLERGQVFRVDMRGHTTGSGPFRWEASSSNPGALAVTVEGYFLVLSAGRPSADTSVTVTVTVYDQNDLTGGASAVFTVRGQGEPSVSLEALSPLLAVGVIVVVAVIVALFVMMRRTGGPKIR